MHRRPCSVGESKFHIGSSQDGSLVQQVAKRECLEQLFRTRGAIGRYFQTKSEQPISGQLGRDQFGTQVEGRLAIGPAPDQGPAFTGQERLQMGPRRQAALIENRNAVLDRPGVRRRRLRGKPVGVDPVEPRGSHGLQPEEKVGGFERFEQLKVNHLALTLDSQPQSQGKGHLGPGVETLSRGNWDSRATQHSLQTAHEVTMADQSEVSALGESESHFGDFCHKSDRWAAGPFGGGEADLYVLLPQTGWPIALHEPGLPSAPRTRAGERSLRSDQMIVFVVQAKPGEARM
jgi:hypothetical protein